MMMPGHTHEDIDACFKLIVDLWKRWGCVLSPAQFDRMLREAIAGMHCRLPSSISWQYIVPYQY